MAIDTKKVFLYQGHLYVSKEKTNVITILGSCVSVCLCDREKEIGGINHYMLPRYNAKNKNQALQYGDIAIKKLLEKMMNNGSSLEKIKAKVFGGGYVIGDPNKDNFFNVGRQNIEIAFKILKKLKIPVIASDVGGYAGRKLVFDTSSSKAFVKKLDSIDKLGDKN